MADLFDLIDAPTAGKKTGDIFDSVTAPYVPPEIAQADAQRQMEQNPPPAPEWLNNAAGAVANTARGFIPTSARDVAGLATPVTGSIEDLLKSYQIGKDVLGGSSLEDATRKYAPEQFQLADAGQTPAYSKERFQAASDTLAQMLMAASIAKGHGAVRAGEVPKSSPSEVPPAQNVAEPRPRAVSRPEPPIPVTESILPVPRDVPFEAPGSVLRPREGIPSPEPSTSAAQREAEFQAMSAKLDELNKHQFLPEPPSVPDAPLAATQGELPPKANTDLGIKETDSGLVRPEGQTEPTPTSRTPDSSEATGIAQRVHDTRGVAVEPGAGVSAEDMVNRGRNLVANGVDPIKTLTDMKATGRINADDISVLRARHEELGKVTNAAEDALRTQPTNPIARRAYEQAWKVENDWAKEIKPFQTEWQKIGMAQQGTTDLVDGSFSSLRRMVVDEKGRDVLPHEAPRLQEAADRVQMATRAEAVARKRLSEAVDGMTKKTRLPETREELAAHFADKFKQMLPC